MSGMDLGNVTRRGFIGGAVASGAVLALGQMTGAPAANAAPLPPRLPGPIRLLVNPGQRSERGPISAGLFTNNHRYNNGGFGLLDLQTQRLKPDLIDTGRTLGVTGLRFPGGTAAVTYDWRQGIGAVQNRPAGYQYGIVEHMQYVEALGPQAVAWSSITLTRGRDVMTLEEATNFVEFMNLPSQGPGSTSWSRMRAQLGHPDPYGIHWWVLGSELGLSQSDRDNVSLWLDGGPSTFPGYLAIRDAMKKIDPSIAVGIGWQVGPGYRDQIGSETPPVIFDALQARNQRFDFIDVHDNLLSAEGSTVAESHYLGIEKATHAADLSASVLAQMKTYPALHPMGFISLENDAGSDSLRVGLHHALANAVSLIALASNGVRFQSHSPYTSGPTNPFGTAIRTEHISFDANFDQWFVQAPAFAYELFAKHVSPYVVPSAFAGPPPTVALSNGDTLPLLYSLAAVAQDRNRLDLVVVNVDVQNEYNVEFDIRPFGPSVDATAYTLTGPSVDAQNSLASPQVIGITRQPVAMDHSTVQHRLPPASVTVLQLTSS
jgi:alpha-N-arabinofuranosidase